MEFELQTDKLAIPSQQLITGFFEPLNYWLSQQYNPQHGQRPHIDFDETSFFIRELIDKMEQDDHSELRKLGIVGKTISLAEWNKGREHKAMMVFLSYCPHYADCLTNISLLASVVIRSVEKNVLGEPINQLNFVEAKKHIDYVNAMRWSRQPRDAEKQSGVSNLGTVSETLLEKALSKLIDDVNFFKTNNQKIQSYGDFVLMSLPNNLWLSVKSNFARERLLASGYTTDIIGVGFFTSATEFTSKSKIRNFQRVGFLAMYLPDIPITEKQQKLGKGTYQEVVEYYIFNGLSVPLNINGTEFIRPLSQLHSDLEELLQIEGIQNRTTTEF